MRYLGLFRGAPLRLRAASITYGMARKSSDGVAFLTSVRRPPPPRHCHCRPAVFARRAPPKVSYLRALWRDPGGSLRDQGVRAREPLREDERKIGRQQRFHLFRLEGKEQVTSRTSRERLLSHRCRVGVRVGVSQASPLCLNYTFGFRRSFRETPALKDPEDLDCGAVP